MIAEAIEVLAKQVRDANKTTIITVAGDKPGRFFLVGPDGNSTPQTTEPAWHAESLARPVELARFVEEEKKERSAVFISEEKIVFVASLDDRRDAASCVLTPSPQWAWLVEESADSMLQFDIVRLLKVVLSGCLPNGSDFVHILSKVQFDSGKIIVGEIGDGRESLGKSITSAVKQAIPDEIVFNIPVFENSSNRWPVRCALETLPQEGRFRITPYPLVLRKTMDQEIDEIKELFAQDGMPPVYLGKP